MQCTHNTDFFQTEKKTTNKRHKKHFLYKFFVHFYSGQMMRRLMQVIHFPYDFRLLHFHGLRMRVCVIASCVLHCSHTLQNSPKGALNICVVCVDTTGFAIFPNHTLSLHTRQVHMLSIFHFVSHDVCDGAETSHRTRKARKTE